MKNASEILPITLRQGKCSKETLKWYGAVVIVVICMRPKRHRKPALPVCIHRPILSYSVKTGKKLVDVGSFLAESIAFNLKRSVKPKFIS